MDRRSDQDIRCKRCSHALDMHWHWRFEWKEVDETQISIDDGMKAKWEGARDKKAKKEAILAAIEKTPANLDVVVERNMITLAELASTYASMSLSGSFSAHLEHALRALREDNADSEQLRRVEASAAELKSKLNVLRDAKAKAQKG
ncbi:hypothetical protein BKA62DRAFT_687029 [Auriculariales sp. MPI-PUGE-AT-0066]|nr:hypothetical protein BKA62DRAFT_687029 [Auriculariales sp. MPI-PUGE-AT-0066]